MSEPRTIECPCCHEPIEYSPEEEGNVGSCPHCQEKVWYSKLAHPNRPPNPTPPSDDAGLAESKSAHPRQSNFSWLIVLLLGGFILFDNYRLRTELRALGNEFRALHHSLEPQTSPATTEQAALAKAELNQAQLNAIVSEVNAIETVIETRLNQFEKRSTARTDRIDSLSRSLESVVEDLEGLEFSVSEIHEALDVLMESYNRLEADLSQQ